MKKTTDEYLRIKGYKEFKPSPIDNQGICKCFQKRFDDEIGKKYFITVNKWDWTYTNSISYDFTYEYTLQLYNKDKHNPINMTLFSGWEIDEVEEFIKELWTTDRFDYYEVFYG